MGSTPAAQVWPLYAVADITGDERIDVGEIVHSDRWEVRYWGREDLHALPAGQALTHIADRWVQELQNEADAANGDAVGATPLSEGRVEWRRVLHNNHLRIGAGQHVDPSH